MRRWRWWIWTIRRSLCECAPVARFNASVLQHRWVVAARDLPRVATARAGNDSAPAAAIPAFTLDRFIVEDGTLVMSNTRDRFESRIDRINLTGSLSAEDGRIDIRAYVDDQPIHLRVKAKTPLDCSLNMLPMLNPIDLKRLTTNKNVPETLRTTAMKLQKQRAEAKKAAARGSQ